MKVQWLLTRAAPHVQKQTKVVDMKGELKAFSAGPRLLERVYSRAVTWFLDTLKGFIDYGSTEEEAFRAFIEVQSR